MGLMKYERLKQYVNVVDRLMFTIDKKNPYAIIYFSENSNFVADYHRLMIRNIEFKRVVIPYTKLPRIALTSEIKKTYTDLGLMSFQANAKFPPGWNMLYDFTIYEDAVDNLLKPHDYRTRAGNFLSNELTNACNVLRSYKKILMYSIDLTKPFNKNYMYRKLLVILNQLKNDNFNFDDLVLCMLTPKGPKYRLLVKNGEFDYNRVLSYLRSLKYSASTSEEELEDSEIEDDENVSVVEDKEVKVSTCVDKVLSTAGLSTSKVKSNDEVIQSDAANDKIKQIVNSYVEKDKETLNTVVNKPDLTPDEAKKIITAAVIFSNTKSLKKTNDIVGKVPPHRTDQVFNKMKKDFIDPMLVKEETKSNSDDPVIQCYNIPHAVGNKNPEHLFQKRSIDFKINLRNDIINSFKVLESKDVPLKIKSVKIDDKSGRPGELSKSDIATVTVILTDIYGQDKTIVIDIPKIDPITGTFSLNGQTKCLINQIILCPISFPKPYIGRFQSSYSIFNIERKMGTRDHLVCFMGSFKNLPLLVLLAYNFGFDKIMNEYGISYTISNEKPSKKDIFSLKLSEESYLYFGNVDTDLKKCLCNSFIKIDPSKYALKEEFGTSKYFNELIIKFLGVTNSTYLISETLDNIVDPVATQVLINQNLPHELGPIFHYMADKVVNGYVEDRGDLKNQRIRGSEVLVHLLQKQVLTAYTVYKMQFLSGNKSAGFDIKRTELISKFQNSEIVTNMEYANPVEEMSTLTRVSPVGKSIGGIPNKVSVTAASRNVHDSYFGNIDPLDTPEGSNVGIVQQLTIDASITSSRGLIDTKGISNDEAAGILSTSSSMIPFVGNNEGARVLMATSQMKQMLPLKNPEPPAIMTGYESILTSVLTPNFIKKSYEDGIVETVTDDFISIKYNNGNKEKIDLAPIHLKCGFGLDTLSTFDVKVKPNQKVKRNEIIAEGSCIKNNTISLGRNLLIAYMPYKGFNYDDGIVISKRLADENELTSVHGIVEEIVISEKDRILDICEIGAYTKKGELLVRKTIGEIEELLGYDEDSDTVVYGQELIKKSPGGQVVDIEVYCNTDPNKFPKLRDLINRTNQRYGMKYGDHFYVKDKKIKGILIKFKIQQENIIGLGDKLSGRYGNKGVISLVEDPDKLPRCYDKETEIFTNNGWKYLSDLNNDDEVAYMKDINNRVAGFTKPINVISYMYNGDMYGASHKNIDYLVTPNHRMYSRTKKSGYRIEDASSINEKYRVHIGNGNDFNIDTTNHDDMIHLNNVTMLSGKKCKSSFNRKDFYELLGWFLSEGSLSYYKSNKEYNHGKSFAYKIQISQSREVNMENCLKIENLLDRMGIKWHYHGRSYTFANKSIYNYFVQFGKCNDKYIPEEIFKNGNYDELRSLFDSLIFGDGSIKYYKSYSQYYTYYTTSRQLSIDVIRLSTLLGYRVNTPHLETKNRNLPKYCIHICTKKNKELHVDKKYYYKTHYNDMVYCVEVPNGLVLVRRNGKQMWCGNCPWGEPVDIVLNPLGVIGRMNMGQILELYSGLISKTMANWIIANPTKDYTVGLFSKILPILDRTDDKNVSRNFIMAVQKMSDVQFKKFVERIKEYGFVSIVVPPFKSPTAADIKKAMGVLGLKTGYHLYLPEYGVRTKEAVPVGYAYMTKLEHIGSLKLHARSTGPYNTKTGQPTGGKRQEGGQRVGEGDTYSMISANAVYLLSEMLGPLSDDHVSENEMISSIIEGGEASFKTTKNSTARDLLGAYFISLMLANRKLL